MLMSILSRKYPKKILILLEKHNKLYFSEINKYIPIHKGSLSRILSELVENELLTKWEEEPNKKMSKTYYSLTNKGKKALLLYKIEEELENLENNQNIIINYHIVNSKNHNVINANVVNIK